MESVHLHKNPAAFRVTLIAGAIGASIVGIMAAIVVGGFFKLVLGDYNYSRILTFLIVIFIAGFFLMIMYGRWKGTHYDLTPEGIVVATGFGDFANKRKIFLYESIITASFNQNYFGKKYGYGDLHVTIPKLEKTLVLKDIDDPSSKLPYLQKHIKNKSGSNNVLVT